uniref:Uncharacterized protein n=1 Tax=Cacopsylla melanoneura TaxID=428564 RepID=A0A8D8VJD4_9HEMI
MGRCPSATTHILWHLHPELNLSGRPVTHSSVHILLPSHPTHDLLRKISIRLARMTRLERVLRKLLVDLDEIPELFAACLFAACLIAACLIASCAKVPAGEVF